jgi:uncharacterized protein (DUF362 family)
MTDSMVAITKVSAYNGEEIRKAVKRSLDLLGGLENVIMPKSKVFVKINLLSPASSPEKAINTHPTFTKEIVRILLEQDCKITIGDDLPSKRTDLSSSGYHSIEEELGVKTVNLKEFGFRKVNLGGEVLSHTHLSHLLLDSDFVVNLPKLKTHSFTSYTGAIKNMYGVIPHGLRLEYHDRFRQQESFNQMLVDVFSYKIPNLNIMDGIVSMEGEGPSAGNPRETDIIAASKDAAALDAVASYIVRYSPLDVLTTLAAHERKLGNGDLKTIAVVGEDIHTLRVPEFKHSAVAIGLLRRKLPQTLYAVIQRQLTLTPKVLKDTCTACEECIQICPVKAIKLISDSAWVDKKTCIHCMCCHEICRFQAIRLNRRPVGLLIRIFGWGHARLRDLFSST